jgi:hypothetical protein
MIALPFRAIPILALALALAACDRGPPPEAKKTSMYHSFQYGDAEKQRRFKEGLKQANVPHELIIGPDGKEYVKWRDEDSAAVTAVQVSLFGEPLPLGRSIHFGAPYQAQFKKWLKETGIPFKTQMSEGKEYIVWEAADYPRVSQWKHFPREIYGRAMEGASNPAVAPGERKSGGSR